MNPQPDGCRARCRRPAGVALTLAGLLGLTATGCSLGGLVHSEASRPLPAKEAPPTPAPVVAAAPEPPPGPPTTPGQFNRRVDSYCFYYDFPMSADEPLFAELGELRAQIGKELRLPEPHRLVQVYLFEDKDRYERFMAARYPDLPKRRAFFVAQPRSLGGADDLLVYTYWGPHIRQDLRHELTHALLHSVLKDVPLWLDEGLAEFFELPREADGLNFKHLENLRRDRPPADLSRLEGLRQVNTMGPAEYRQAWAWVHLMLRGGPDERQVLLAYLQQLRTSANPGPLQPRLAAVFASLPEAFGEHLAGLGRTATAKR